MIKYFILLCLLTLTTACQRDVEHQHTIHFAVAQAPINLDPRYATDAASERVNRLIYQSLVDFDAASKVIPSLATWHKVNDREYRLTLKKDRALFHNQTLLTSVDVVTTYQSILQLQDSPHKAEFANILNISAIDSENVSFQLKQDDPHFISKLIVGILPEKLISNGHDFSRNPVGNGPLKFVSWKNKLRLLRVKDGQTISLQQVKDPTVRVLKLLRGETDLLQGDLPPELVKYLQSKSDIAVKTSAGANFSYLGLNMQDPLLKQLKVRQAIAHAIDREAVINKVMVGKTRIAGSLLPPEHYAGNAKLVAYDYDPARSKKLLQAAGVKLPLKLVYKTSTDAQRVRFATILQAQMALAGITLEIRSLDWGTFFEEVKQGKFQLYGLTWVGIKTPEIYSKVFASDSTPPTGFNRGRYADDKLDALLAEQDWQAATARIHHQLPYIPLWYEGQPAAMRKEIQHYLPKPDGNWDDLATIKRSATIAEYAH